MTWGDALWILAIFSPGLAIVWLLVGIYRNRNIEDPRPGYLLPPTDPGSWYEEYIDERGHRMVRPRATLRAWERGEDR